MAQESDNGQRKNPWQKYAGKSLITPSLLACDYMQLGQQVNTVLDQGCEVLHVDVMDGHFVPNLAISPGIVKSVRKHTDAFLDVHLMITNPLKYTKSFVDCGADSITFHVESDDDPGEMLELLNELGVGAAVVIKPKTSVDLIKDYLHLVDLVLIMTVEPGFGGQSFMADQMPKVRQVRELSPDHVRIQVDGGIDSKTIYIARDAGADTFVAGSSVFGSDDIAAAYRTLDAAVNVKK